jgi:hypothetical protein
MGAALANFNGLFLGSVSGVTVHGLFPVLVHSCITFKEWKTKG